MYLLNKIKDLFMKNILNLFINILNENSIILLISCVTP